MLIYIAVLSVFVISRYRSCLRLIFLTLKMHDMHSMQLEMSQSLNFCLLGSIYCVCLRDCVYNAALKPKAKFIATQFCIRFAREFSWNRKTIGRDFTICTSPQIERDFTAIQSLLSTHHNFALGAGFAFFCNSTATAYILQQCTLI